MKKRVLILMSDTGGGHRAAAEAIRDALYLQHGEAAVAVQLVDVFREYAGVPLKYMPEFYPWLVNNSKSGWGAGYKFLNTRRRAKILSTTVYHSIEKGLKRMFRQHPADVVVNVHSLVTYPGIRTLLRQPYRPPFMVVVTDLVSTHHLWYDRRVDRCLVPTQTAYERGLAAGLKPEQMRVTGLPVHPNFISGLKDRAEARAELGWDLDLPAIVLIGGGDGMGPVFKTAQTINDRHLPCQLIVIAGRNATLKRQLEAMTWNQPTQIYGFRTDMPVIMAATDVLVTKAGPATITEACIAGVPLILYDAIPGQETGNVEFVVKNDVGVFAPTPSEITATLEKWLGEGRDSLRARAQRAREISRPNAVFDIANEVWDYAHSEPLQTKRRRLWKNVTIRAINREL